MKYSKILNTKIERGYVEDIEVIRKSGSPNKKYMFTRSYIAGIWEGNGHITFRKNSKNCTPAFGINCHRNQRPWLEELQKELGGIGSIVDRNDCNTSILFIQARNDLIKVVDLLNGHLKSPKIKNFNKLIDWLNENLATKFKHQPINYDLNDHWLSGFIDVKGSFYIMHKKGDNPKMHTQFGLKQKMYLDTGESYEKLLSEISKFLECKLYENSDIKSNKSFYRIQSVSLKQVPVLIKYLDEYPLRTTKYLDYLAFKKAFYIWEAKEFKAKEDEIAALKSEMNKSRSVFTWDHLKAKYKDDYKDKIDCS